MADQTAREVLASFPPFADAIEAEYRQTMQRPGTLQMNVGYKCNIACRHCHLNCSPARTEEMDRETMEACLDAYQTGGFSVLDITGGAPEMNPNLEWLIETATGRGIPLICRTNLCILLEPEYEHFADVYARNNVHLFASLPFYSATNCDKIRGQGVFEENIVVLRKLNELGYGRGAHTLTLVYNPPGPSLPPDMVQTESDYHKYLLSDFGVEFDNLVGINNMPCGRFAETLNKKGRLGRYMQKLIGAFNPETVPAMMCRDQISVDWQGRIYDCDFNQAMGLPTPGGATIFDWVDREPQPRKIAFGNWCYACTAGSGSS